MTDAEITARLTTLCDELSWLSESDRPVEPISVMSLDTLSTPNATAESVSWESLFAKQTRLDGTSTPQERERAGRFTELASFLNANLTTLQAFRTGSVQVTLSILGQSESGIWLGIRTVAIET